MKFKVGDDVCVTDTYYYRTKDVSLVGKHTIISIDPTKYFTYECMLSDGELGLFNEDELELADEN